MRDSPEKIAFLDTINKYMADEQVYTVTKLIGLYKLFSGKDCRRNRRTVISWLKSDHRIDHYSTGKRTVYCIRHTEPVTEPVTEPEDNYVDLEKLATIIPEIVKKEVERIFPIIFKTVQPELLESVIRHIDTTLKKEFQEDLIPSMISTVNDKVESKSKELDRKILQSARALRTAVDGQFRKIKAAIE